MEIITLKYIFSRTLLFKNSYFNFLNLTNQTKPLISMKTDKASRTAQYMALFRALETNRPRAKRLFNDPYAASFLDSGLKTATKISNFPVLRELIQKIIQQKVPGAFSSGLARTKYIDDLLQETIDNGVKQVIILGAGFDTRALRLDFLKQVSVIEIDHPNTAKLKLDTLKESFKKLPDNIKYLQIDFNKESLEDLAINHSIDFSIPTTIIWEGVTNYLDKHAIDSTFKFAESFSKESYIIFTYVNNMVLDQPNKFYGAEKLLKDLAEIEEHWTFGFKPEELKDYLIKYNYILLEDLGAAAYREKYIPERNEKGYEFYRVAFAVKHSLKYGKTTLLNQR